MTELKEKEPQTSAPAENKMGVMPVGRLVFSMSLPIMISMLVQALYNIVDSLFVSQINQNAFTAVSLAFPLQTLMIGVAVGTGVGVNANLSRSLGEKQFEKADKFAKNGLFLAALSYVAFVVFAVFFTDIYFTAQSSVRATVEYGKQYLFIISIASIGVFVQVMCERLLQSTGNTVLAMYSQGLGAVINLVLDPVLIFVCDLGVAGAALATVIGQCASALFGIYLNIKYNKEINISMKGFRPDGELIKKIYAVGVPSIIMQSITSVMTFMFNRILTSFGSLTDTLQSILGAYFKLQSFIFMPVFGLNNGTIPIISYNFGAGKRTRLVKTIKISAAIALSIMLFGLALMQIFPEQLLHIFKATDEMLKYGAPALRIISLSFIFAGICIVFTSAFQSLGHSVNSMLVSIARQLIILIPSAYLLAGTGDPNKVWWAFPIAEIASLTASSLFMVNIVRKVIRPMPDNA